MNKKSIGYHVIFLIEIFVVTPMIQCEPNESKHAVSTAEDFIQISDGVELYYQIMGSESDTLIMLHGGPGLNFDYLAPDLNPLIDSYTLIFFDQRGTCRSTIVTDPDLPRLF